MHLKIKGRHVRSIRKGLQLTQAKFAKKLGISQAAVCMWEKDRRVPNRWLATVLRKLWRNGARSR